MCVQGVRLERSENYLLLLQKYGFHFPRGPTKGYPDMVHLVFNAYTFSRRQYKGIICSPANCHICEIGAKNAIFVKF